MQLSDDLRLVRASKLTPILLLQFIAVFAPLIPLYLTRQYVVDSSSISLSIVITSCLFPFILELLVIGYMMYETRVGYDGWGSYLSHTSTFLVVGILIGTTIFGMLTAGAFLVSPSGILIELIVISLSCTITVASYTFHFLIAEIRYKKWDDVPRNFALSPDQLDMFDWDEEKM